MSYWKDYFKDLLTAEPTALNGETEMDTAESGLRSNVGGLGGQQILEAGQQNGRGDLNAQAEEWFNDVDWKWVQNREGFETKGYVPTGKNGKAIGKSGVTIGGGIDLGHWDEESLRRAGLSDEEIAPMTEYLGLKGDTAIRKLKENPLRMDKDILRGVDKKIYISLVGDTRNLYDKKAGKGSFDKLPSEIKTTIASTAINFGNKNLTSFNLWDELTSGNFDKAVNNLRTWGGPKELRSRRKLESDLLSKGIKRMGDSF